MSLLLQLRLNILPLPGSSGSLTEQRHRHSLPGTPDKIMIVLSSQIYYNLNIRKQSKSVKGGMGHVNIHDDDDSRNGRISYHSVYRLS